MPATAIEPGTTVASIARNYPSTIKVFQRHRLDFCCGGKRPLAEACDERGLDPSDLLAELRLVVIGDAAQDGWGTAPIPELVRHIVEHYHRKLRDDLPVLHELAVKVASRHGVDAPALLAVRELVAALVAELHEHMEKEEIVLFPLALRLAAGNAPAMPIDGPCRAMEHEHTEVAGMLERLRSLTGGFVPPDWACNSFRGLYSMLAELDGDLRMHIHLENNVLFPRAEELARAFAAPVR